MTRQDFQLIADTLRQLREESALCFDNDDDFATIVQIFAIALSGTNPRFAWQRFREAAGVVYYGR